MTSPAIAHGSAFAKRRTDPAGNIERQIRCVIEPDSVVEIRAFRGRDVLSGYYNDPTKLAAEAAKLIGSAEVVYFTLNRLDPRVLFRSPNALRTVDKNKPSTSDVDVTRRILLPIDADPVRPAGVPSSDEEHEDAIRRVRGIAADLAAEGWPEPIVGDTGNGAALLYRIDLPADEGGIVQKTLKALDLMYSDGLVKIDTSVYNPARIWKLMGTTAGSKGANTSERPHRMARHLDTPQQVKVVSREQLEALIKSVPIPTQEPRRTAGTPGAFDLDNWIAQHLSGLDGPRPWGARGRKWVGDCPWSADHRDGSFYVVQFHGGAIAAGCKHNGCDGRDWHDLRGLIQPARAARTTRSPHHVAEPDPTEPVGFYDDDQMAALGMIEDLKKRTESAKPAPPADILIASTLEGVVNPSAGEVKYLIDKVLPDAAFTLQGAGFKTGKTLVWYSAALDVARGASVFGHYRVAEPVKVVVFQFEMPSREDDRRFRRLAIGAGMYPGEVIELVKTGYLTVYNRPPINLGVPRDIRRFHDAIRRADAGFVLVDSCIAAFAGQDINDNGIVRQLVADAFGPLTSEGRALLGLHHKRKKVSGSRPDEDDRHAIIGAQAWQASADRVYALERLDFAPIAHDDAKQNRAFRLRLSPVGSWTPEDSEDIVIEVRDVTSKDLGEGTSVLALAERAQLVAGGVTTQQRVALALLRLVRMRRCIAKAEAFAVVGGDENVKERTLDAALTYAKGKRWIDQRKAENGKKNAQELIPGADEGDVE